MISKKSNSETEANIKTTIAQIEKKILDNQLLLQNSLEQKLASVVGGIEAKCQSLQDKTNKKTEEADVKFESSGADLKKSSEDLYTETQSFNNQYKDHFVGKLQVANARIAELTASQSASVVVKFANEIKATNDTIIANVVANLKNALQPILQVVDHICRA
ncbi:hypothetical protein L1887_40779 [Cichorium endivia]|nr:hypothetical protein L1887_40779 [Cichorium endivia]